MTPAETATCVALMTAALPREWSFLTEGQQKATETTYAKLLSDIPFPAAYTATEELLATATKMPTIAEIRAAALRVMHGSVRPGGDAWGDVRKLSSYRDVGEVSGIDPLVLRVCRAMGWIKHRTLFRGGAEIEQWRVETGDNESADRARFTDLYDEYAIEKRREENVSQLPAAQRYRALKAAHEQKQLGAMTRPTTDPTLGGPRRVDFARLLPGDKTQ